jgi:iron complex outermembrane recepter protein
MPSTLLPILLASLAGLAPPAASSQSAQASQAVPPVTLPTVVVTAQKEPADAQRLPVSVTAVPRDVVDTAAVRTVSDVAGFSANTRFAELSARKISNAFMRGIGSSPSNPGITTYIDGVPQLNSNSSSVELTDIEQVEFVRGPQSALFGRNTLGGVVSLATARPSLGRWSGQASVPFGSANARDVRLSASGPVAGGLALGVSYGHGERDGFTTNDVTGKTVDTRSADFGKVQALWIPTPKWETRLVVSGERDRDGDYALADLGQVRSRPFHVARDYAGSTDRTVWSTVASVRHEGAQVAFTSTTGYVSWDARDRTDLDYSPMPLMTRDNGERDRQFTEEVRVASAAAALARLSDGVTLAWQSGLFLFTQQYSQNAVNTFAPYVLSPYVPVSVSQQSPLSDLDDAGVGVYGQAVLTVRDSVDLTFGARLDRERKRARIESSYQPAIAPPTLVQDERTFGDVSPQAALAYRVSAGHAVYASVGRGFKAGGFNAASPAGSEAYGEERAWNLEGGYKSEWAGGRVVANVAAFRIDWDDMQLNVPNPLVPAQFYIANVGRARSSGVEAELRARPQKWVELFASAGLTHARFRDGSSSGGVDVSGKELPNAPAYTAWFGAQVSRKMGASSCFARADVGVTGAYHYDEANTASQGAFTLVNLRAGLRGRWLIAEAWLKNALDTRYVPVAFAYPGLAPSGFLGEPGQPRTYGVSLGIGF